MSVFRLSGLVAIAGFAAVASKAAALGGLPATTQLASSPSPAASLAPPDASRQDQGRELTASALSAYTPPACVAGVPFADVTCTTPYDAWIEQFAADGITGGCGGGNYCPNTTVTRAQMAVFIERAMRGTGNWPPHVAFAWAVKDSTGAPDPTASGTALLNALASIPTSGNDAPSASNPWLLQVGPGIFDIGSAQPTLPAYVSLFGSGVVVTTIQGSNANGQVLYCDGNSDVAFLTAISVGTGTQASGLWLNGPTRITHVGVQVSGATNINSALVINESGTVTLNNVRLQATGTGTSSNRGIELQAGTILSHSGQYIASGGGQAFGMVAFGGSAQVFDVTLQGGTNAIYNNGGALDVAGSEMTTSSNNASGTLTCAGVYNGSFAFYASTCP